MTPLSVAERLALLRQVKLFGPVPQAELQTIAERTQAMTYPREHFIFFEGEPATTLYIVHSGRVKIFRTSDSGQDLILQMPSTRDIFGGIAALGGDNVYPATAQTLEASVIVTLSGEDFEQLVRRLPELAWAIIRFLQARLFETQEQVRALTAERVERRFARILLRLSTRMGNPMPDSSAVDLPVSRQTLADMTATTLETISRIVSRWQSQGIVRAGREHITLLAPERLQAIVADLVDS